MSGKINYLNFKRHWIIKREQSKYKPSSYAFPLKITQIRIIYINFKDNPYNSHCSFFAISLFFIRFAKSMLIHNCNLYYFDKFRLKHKEADKIVLIFFSFHFVHYLCLFCLQSILIMSIENGPLFLFLIFNILSNDSTQMIVIRKNDLVCE